MSPVQIGARMWTLLSPTFDEVLKENRFNDVTQKAQAWAAFLAGASGAMCKDIGFNNGAAVLCGVGDALKAIEMEVEQSKVSH